MVVLRLLLACCRQATQNGLSFYNKCSGLVDIADLSKAVNEGKKCTNDLKIADIEALLAAAFAHRENPGHVDMLRVQLAEVVTGSAAEAAIPPALLAEACKVVSEAADAEAEKNKTEKKKK